ncbi:protein-L-isoaspartate O-methyltransferase [Methylopila jiangsuensis]|uniref:Protein-L-isoaspartate O-methyltransferase n=1 Tax=Methylopila jiangsuensis TaxID=586230 RepID=A0A9W6N312_9HYPH|nr:protein-L-isoaspartate(D-aspartate) O-methyltransferase [Methylopila jiangsuensis]MDR6286092.1 protein-L-isoaspartate(D-aspartate) O-methyltransferase [Methylopila jiangsuensis]GLK75850.1 protein-L-isoaspartate O-methyltransferase [Methylopila jiangsuensis]
MGGAPDEQERTRRAELVLKLRSRGVRDTRTLKAIETIPRTLFVRSEHHGSAYLDRALPIACGQTLEAPSHIAAVIDALGAGEGDVALEVGTGSGYQTAILSRVARKVVSLERWRGLAGAAARRLEALGGVKNVEIVCADGALGLSAQAPFDRIVVSAAVEAPPSALLNQLKPGGVMIAPVGRPGKTQRITRFVKAADGALSETTIGEARVSPLLDGISRAL